MSKILKAGAVTIDRQNTVIIEVAPAMAAASPETYEDNFIFDAEAEAEDIIQQETPEQIAEKIINAAKEEAEQIISGAKKKAEKEAEAISDSAYEQGYQEGMDLAAAEGDAIKAKAQKVLLDAEDERKALLKEIEPEAVKLIIDIVGKLINNSVEINPQIIVALIKQGLAGANLTGEVNIHVSPQDYDAVTEHRDELAVLTDSSTRLEILKDPSLNVTDCVIETPFGNVDCSLNQGYESLVSHLKFILKKS